MLRLRALWRNIRERGRVERELDEEVRAMHVLLAEEKVASGLQPAEARRAATIELGQIESIKERVREVRAGAGLDTLVQDVRYGARLLCRNPLLTVTATLSLAVCIGANTAIFSLVNRLLLRQPPGVVDPGRLVDIAPVADGQLREPFIHPTMLDEIQRRATLVEGVYGHQLDVQAFSLQGEHGAERVFGAYVTTNYFGILGVQPTVGRLFGRDDREERGASPMVVLSHSFWMRRFLGDTTVVGRSVSLNGHPITIIGVADEEFRGISPVVNADFWLPASMASVLKPRGAAPLAAGARLRSGVSAAQATAELEAIASALSRDLPVGPTPPPGFRDVRSMSLRAVPASPLPPVMRGLAAGVLALLMGLVSMVLMIACANLAGVLLARGAARRREIAVRLAVGAGRMRLVRQLITETCLLFALGGVAGLVLAKLIAALLALALPPLPVPVDTSLPFDHRVIAFTLGLTFVAALVAGVFPALQSCRSDVAAALKSDAQGPSERLRVRHAFVVAQVALSIVLVVAAGLFARAIQATPGLVLSVDARGVETTALDLSLAGYTDTTGPAFVRDILERARALPRAASASVAAMPPGGGQMRQCCGISVPGGEPPPGEEFFQPVWNVVEPGYFETLGVPVLHGRDFGAIDRPGSDPVAIISETAARQFWPADDAVGRQLLWQQTPGRSAQTLGPTLLDRTGSANRDPVRLTVVGVVKDVYAGGDSARSVIYLPLQQRYQPDLSLITRSIDGGRVAGEIRALVTSLDPNLPVISSEALGDRVTPVMFQLRLAAGVSAGVGVVGLLLAAIGIYGVTAYAVTRRTREIGIRVAMGAQPADLVRMVLRQGMALVLTGSAIGMALAAGTGRLLAHNRFGIPAVDPLTFGAALTLFALVGLLACYAPVRRATAINAVEALRHE